MTAPITHARERIITAMLRAGRVFTSQRQIAIAAGLIDETTPRSSARMRVGQRAVCRLVQAGLIRQNIDSHKTDNAYTLTPAAKAYAAAMYPETVRPQRRADQPRPEAPR
jgi:hypothetical protein